MLRRLFLLVGLLLPLFAVLLSAGDAQASPAQTSTARGIAKFYSPGVFARVAANRHMRLRSDVDGYAALPSCRNIGRIITAQINRHRTERYQVLDCFAPGDYARLTRQGLVIEVDWQSAVRNGFSSRGSAPAIVFYP